MIIKALSEPNKKSIWLALGWTSLILILSFKAPSLNPKISFTNQDKVVHFLFYFVFVFLWYRYFFSIRRKTFRVVLIIVGIAILIGMLIEYLQGVITVDRHSDIYDVLANSLGALTGALFSFLFLNKEKR